MTTESKVEFLQMSQQVADLNNKLLALIGNSKADEETASELLQASQKLIQAQNNIMKAVK